MEKLNKKGQIFNQMGALGVGIAGLAITLIITFLIISQGRSNIVDNSNACYDLDLVYNATTGCCTDVGCVNGAYNATSAGGFSSAFNATQTLGSAVDTIPGWVPLIVIAVIGSILLGLVAMFRNR